MTTKIDGRKTRKKSVRRTKTGRKKPDQSERWRRMWADPATREKMLASARRGRESKKHRRSGTFDGYSAAESAAKKQSIRTFAEHVVEKLMTKGIIDQDIDPSAKDALLETISVMKLPIGEPRIKLMAARQVLEWTLAKPAAKSEVTVNQAVEWLNAVANDEDDEQETSGDEEAAS